MAVSVLSPTNFLSTLQLAGSSVLAHSAYTAKGVLLVGSAVGVATVLTIGANGTIATADSAETTGIKWAVAGSGSKAFGLMMSR